LTIKVNILRKLEYLHSDQERRCRSYLH
jgi:hypothetical protein